MCGIAGYFGISEIPQRKILSSLDLLNFRGPNSQNHKKIFINKKININFLHTRLAIIDLEKRSNQPMTRNNITVVFNGEIYNFLELKSYLKNKGMKFITKSDTEVLLNAYIHFGENFLDKMEGMWAFAIFDKNKNKLILSRDRFSEKPLFYSLTSDGFYFSSDIRVIKNLSASSYQKNYQKIITSVVCGYKSNFKKESETCYKNIFALPGAHKLEIDTSFKLKISRYWSLKSKINNKITNSEEIVKHARDLLFKSIDLRLRSDVPLAFSLSGGVDSGTLMSIATKEFGIKPNSFSIIDQDPRYSERKNINLIVKDLNSNHKEVFLDKQNTSQNLDQIKELISYKSSPLPTITSFLSQKIAKISSSEGFKVLFSGTAADEIFSGYYDHHLLYLNDQRDSQDINLYKRNFRSFIKPLIRNKLLQKENIYKLNSNFREHIYDQSNIFFKLLNPDYQKKKQWFKFVEKKYSKNLFSNRRLNELFHEIVPVGLSEEDTNSMYYSIENRSPFLDRDLIEYMFSVDNKFLIKDGYSKNILREIAKGYLNDKVRLDRKKIGYNSSISSIIDTNDKALLNEISNSKSEIFEFFDKKKILKILNSKEKNLNHTSKFIFSFLNAKIFLDN